MSGDRHLDHTMFDMVQRQTISDSLKFGKAPDIHSILVETAFIGNVEEQHKLRYQHQVVETILHGIKAYFEKGGVLARR